MVVVVVGASESERSSVCVCVCVGGGREGEGAIAGGRESACIATGEGLTRLEKKTEPG